jgi:hypothetical protein
MARKRDNSQDVVTPLDGYGPLAYIKGAKGEVRASLHHMRSSIETDPKPFTKLRIWLASGRAYDLMITTHSVEMRENDDDGN